AFGLTLLLLVLVVAPVLADTFTVNTTADYDDGSCDAGDCTLREAIIAANSSPGPDTIAFNIPDTDPGYNAATGVWRIQPSLTPVPLLPSLTDGQTTIDGTTQTANQGDRNPAGPEVELNGARAGTSPGLVITSISNTIRGLIINEFTLPGIVITGTQAQSNTVVGNFIGVDATGSAGVPNGAAGVLIYNASNNTVGGTGAGDRNLISGNNQAYWNWFDDAAGVYIYGPNASGNRVIGNYIGTNITGTAKVGNYNGVNIEGGAHHNFVGGSGDGEGNLLSGNEVCGVLISGAGTVSNTVQGNLIGANASATLGLGNDSCGVFIEGEANYNLIGGTEAGAGNVIVDHLDEGISLDADYNRVQGNYIGLIPDGYPGIQASQSISMGNHRGGILIYGQHNLVGGLEAGAGNVIAFNGEDGVLVQYPEAMGNSILHNSIYSNTMEGIHLDQGANGGIISPTIEFVSSRLITGTSSCLGCTVEVFSDYGNEGRVFEGSTTTDPTTGIWELHWFGPSGGPRVTATVTDQDGNTSEFSAGHFNIADLDYDGDVDVDDIMIAVNLYRQPASPDFPDPDRDGDWDIVDIQIVCGQFGWGM
ncbi:MAG TPA: CSLREA domain-containing protein, partial [Anaerolineae bacterium]|nr:CSLREA domain-containing protein [Anaerolineae bacterium]